MNEIRLGRLLKTNPREVWASEASDFTPWLASAENIALLGETLGMELEVEAREQPVGPFRADILCKDLQTDRWILIENQLEKTDHTHLGQLLTYASGLNAVAVVWIATKFTEEHRSTLDWLNQITMENFQFFGLEVEVWRIGTSEPAPKFNIVSKPNDWSQSVARAAREIDAYALSDLRKTQLDYWTSFLSVLTAEAGPVHGNRKPQAQCWQEYSVGRTGFCLLTTTLRQERRIRAGVYIAGEWAKIYFNLLQNMASEIERDAGFTLVWEALPEKRDCRISVYLEELNPELRSDWPRQHKWLAEKLNTLYRVFSRRVKSLDIDDSEQEL